MSDVHRAWFQDPADLLHHHLGLLHRTEHPSGEEQPTASTRHLSDPAPSARLLRFSPVLGPKSRRNDREMGEIHPWASAMSALNEAWRPNAWACAAAAGQVKRFGSTARRSKPLAAAWRHVRSPKIHPRRRVFHGFRPFSADFPRLFHVFPSFSSVSKAP